MNRGDVLEQCSGRRKARSWSHQHSLYMSVAAACSGTHATAAGTETLKARSSVQYWSASRAVQTGRRATGRGLTVRWAPLSYLMSVGLIENTDS